MPALGKWKFYVDTMFYRGDAILAVFEKEDGDYDVGLEIPGMANAPEIEVVRMEVDGNTINGAGKTDLLKGKEIPFSATFDGDTASGFIKIPFIGRIKLTNGVRVG